MNASAGETPGSCSIGDLPRYTVNATSPEDVSKAVKFAGKHNIRLVIKDTGHDILGRSNGYGSLEVWIRHLRTGLKYDKKYKSYDKCSKSTWAGGAFTIGGGYTWKDVYPLAAEHDVVVVGGGTPTVGCLGGWMQGGGHGPASHEYGLGADQVLEAKVVLADGSIVIASPCSNSDIYFAIRGGGPGTYGVVVETTVKAHPNNKMAVQHLAIAPLTKNLDPLIEAVAIMFSAYPELCDADYAGYGTWTVASPTPIFGKFTAGFVHGIYMFGKTEDDAKTAFESTLARLQPLNGSDLFVSVSYVAYDTYWHFYGNESGVEPPVGGPAALGSRLFDKPALTSDFGALKDMISTIAGTAEEYTSNNFEIVSGGQVFKDAADPYSGVLPAWRKSYLSNIVARGWAPGSNDSVKQAVHQDITHNKVQAMKDLAPDTGCYMNEGDWQDPDYKVDFYGSNYDKFASIKAKYDPLEVFYCPTCVGSDKWTVASSGQLCRKS